MANDESYKKEIMEQIDKLGNFAEKINKEFGFNASEDNENNTIFISACQYRRILFY